jgi:hypothetical protein
MTDKNMAIWDAVYKTPPSATKGGKVGGQNITSINGLYVAKRATEVFGPCGTGWGYEVAEERYDEAGPIFDATTKELICQARNHTIRLELWYMADGEKRIITHFGHTKYLYRSKYGFTVDDEAPKKSLTDALKKCLSMIGIGGDIFMGEFDDHNYIQEQRNQEAIDKAENRDEEEARQVEEYKIWRADAIRLIGESTTLTMLEGLFNTSVRKADRRGDTKGVKLINEATNAKKAELKGGAK